jgi:RNA polymerase sigma factor (sigma-70 family)
VSDGPVATASEVWPPSLVELYAAERTELVRAAFLVCGSVASAEDAVHDALARVAERWDRLERARSYLYVAVVNAARDAARRDQRSARFLARRTSSDASEDLARLSAESLTLHGALARLPVNHRTAIALRYFLDWDDDEIATHLGVRPATVRSWVHRGVTKLRKDLA